MHFGENQLSPSLIGLSPLPTAHPLSFQPKWVRSSTRSYPRFNLAMGRSLGFGSRARDCIALFGLALATATPHGLTSPRTTNSQAHSSKGTQSPPPRRVNTALTAWRHTVSGTISPPSPAPPPRALPQPRLFSPPPPVRQNWPNGPTTPPPQPLPGITWKRFSLIRFRSPLLTESRLFSLPVGTEMFHFPTFPPHALCVQARVTPHDWCGVPPFGHPRINARLAAPRGLSQPPTSFIGSWCPGIHRVPLTTWPHSYNTPHTPHPAGTGTPPKEMRHHDRACARACKSK